MSGPRKHPGGRPSTYDPAYCDAIIDYMAEGYSVTAFAGSVRVSRQTIYNWADEHPEFFDALEVGRAAAATWWEGRLRDTAEKGEGNATAAIFGLKNRAAEEWREKSAIEHTGKDQGPIQTENVSARDILADRISRLSAAASAKGDTGEPDGSAGE